MEFEDIISIIYNFYPKHCKYGSKIYKKTEEYKNYLNGIKKDFIYKDIRKALKKAIKNYYLKVWRYKDEVSVHFSILLHKNQDILDDDIELINSLGRKRGYLKLRYNLVNEIVPDIETELHYEGEANVFHCLFSDYGE